MIPARNKEPAFWDASAVLPLCVHEGTSRRARSELRRFMPVAWWGTTVEVYSAIARLYRRGDLTERQKAGALARLDLLGSGWREILPSDRVRQLATELLDKYELRAADSLQLAAALVWCQVRPARRSFLSADHRLSEAARTHGFLVVELS